jgi:arginine-tRNA-protein transferase
MSEAFLQGPRDPAPVVLGPSHPCPYLPERDARFAYAVRMPEGEAGFGALLDAGFRRSGLYVYRTQCDFCRACRPLRLRVSRFRPDRAQLRALKANADLEIAVGSPRLDEEKLDLYRRYLAVRHDGQMSAEREEIEAGLYRSPVTTIEITARRDGVLKATGVVDVAPDTLSLVYCAYDPDEPRRSYGTAYVQWAVAFARSIGFEFVHLGYWVAGSPTMDYKAKYRPHEVLDPDGTWREVDGRPGPPRAGGDAVFELP